jgi:transcriptional regulator with XRE-family HTH domain
MSFTPPHTGRQLAAARALLNITQDELAERAGLHVNSVYNLEQQEPITAGYSRNAVATVLTGLGVLFFTIPNIGIRLRGAEDRASPAVTQPQ